MALTGRITHYERSPVLEERLRHALVAGALPPPPQDLSLDASPDAGLCAGKRIKGDAEASPYRSVEAPESVLRLLPSMALSCAQSELILLRRGTEAHLCDGF